MQSLYRFFPILTLPAVSFLHTAVEATPLDHGAIPNEAQWLLHLDVDDFRETTIGQAFVRELTKRAEEEAKKESLPINPVLVINGLRGLTLYGTSLDLTGEASLEGGVALIEGTPGLIQIFQGMIAGMELEAPDRIQRFEQNAHQVYAIDGEFYGSVLDETTVVLGKSPDSIGGFLRVRDGSRSGADFNTRFRGYRPTDHRFFLAVFAEGINRANGLPAQARVLQLTEGLSLQLGEGSDRLRLNLALVTDSTQTANQVRQVLQGLLALLSLTQSGDPDLDALTRSAAFSIDDRTVRCDLFYPVDRAMFWIDRLAAMCEAARETPAPPAPEAEDREDYEEDRGELTR